MFLISNGKNFVEIDALELEYTHYGTDNDNDEKLQYFLPMNTKLKIYE